ncbi:MAG: SDR family oxidoreductase [Desulfuromonadales bacterium]|nr:SDR family oxidoreductase [Desulfuromonadales bacterium]
MKIVVTGALGHIGSRLVHRLPDSFPTAQVLLVDDLSTQRYCSLFNLPAHGRYRFVEADVLSADLEELFRGASAVVHLAAITNAEGSFQNAQQVEEVNFTGTRRVAAACLRSGAPLLFLSTTSVYGTQAEVVDESCSAAELQPQSPYAESKLRAEQLLQELGREEGLRFVICRFGTIFGISPGMRFHTAVNKFIWQACTGTPLTVWSSALDQQRPYLDLEDAVRALRFIIGRDLFDGEVYNVLTLNATVREIVAAIQGCVPDVTVNLVEARIMNQLSYAVCCRRFRELGFEFTGDLQRRVAESVALLRGVRQW